MGELERKVKEPIPLVERVLHAIVGDNPGVRSEVIEKSRKGENHYLAWEAVRRQRAGEIVGSPFYLDARSKKIFLEPTGFEPYLMAIHKTPEQIVEEEVSLGRKMFRNIVNELSGKPKYLNSGDPGEIDTLTLNLRKFILGKDGLKSGEVCEYTVAINKILGAELGRLRVPTVSDPDLSAFRDETYREIRLNPILYFEENGTLMQEFCLPPSLQVNDPLEFRVDFKGRELEGYQILANIGAFGHPLIRTALSQTKLRIV